MRLPVRVTPKSSRLEVAGWDGKTLRIKLTKNAQGGEANEQLRSLLASLLHIPKSSIRIVLGERRREKILEIPDDASARLPENRT